MPRYDGGMMVSSRSWESLDRQAPPWITWLRLLVAAVFTVATIVYVWTSLHWPLVWDMQVIHYVCFLMDRGLAPYRQIGDMNMPGAYMLEHLALDIFGKSDLGWRFYDFTLCAALSGAMIVIARRYDWMAGVFAAGVFLVMHAGEGPRNAGQRDQEMTVLLMIGMAVLFAAVRSRKTWWMLFFGLAVGMAGAIKPLTLLMGPMVLAPAMWYSGMRRLSDISGPGGALARAYAWWSALGVALVGGAVLVFLLHWHALGDFWRLLVSILPHYLSVGPPVPWWWLALHALPPIAWALAAVAVGLTVIRWIPPMNWESLALAMGAIVGLLSYYLQHKGAPQHRYTAVAFVLLWSSILLANALKSAPQARMVAVACIALVLAYFVPHNIREMLRWRSFDNFSRYLQGDLQAIGPDRLQHQVQCLDIVDGCLTALYHLKVEQETPATGDLLYFQRQAAPPVVEARQTYWHVLEQDGPPSVLVLSNWHFGEDRDFNLVDTWPQFAGLLRKDYVMVVQREFFWDDPPTSHPGSNPAYPAYRIYIRRDSPLLTQMSSR